MVWMAGDSDTAWLCMVFVLAVTAAGGNNIPAIILNHFDYITNFHL